MLIFQVPPPQKPLTAYFLYAEDQKEIVRRAHPEVKGLEMYKIIATQWHQLDQAQKDVYEKRHDVLKEEYKKLLEEYERKYGPVERPKRYF